MLQPYEFKFSKLHKVNSFVNYIMLEVILKAKKFKQKSISQNMVLPKYWNLIAGTNKKHLHTPLNKIFKICKTLDKSNIRLLKKAVHNNGQIEKLCDGILQPIRYKEIEAINKELAKEIRIFCDSLYVDCLKIACFYNQYEQINNYYKNFIGRKTTCRCCGVGMILNQFHKHRSALDHYLPKSVYPFVGVNFKNLIPICDTCNEKYKLDKDTLLEIVDKGKKNENKIPRVAFYPFSKFKYDIDIKIKLLKPYCKTLTDADIDIQLSNTANQFKVDNWERIFGVKDNYKALCCSEEMTVYYEEYFSNSLINRGISLKEHLEDLGRNKYYEKNFLKIPFLEAVNT